MLKNLKVFGFIAVMLFIVTAFSSTYSQEHHNAEDPNTTEDKNKLDIVDRVVDHHDVDLYFFGKLPLPHIPPVTIGGITLDFSITKSLFMMILSSTILILVLTRAASINKKNKVPKGIGNLIEILIVFVRDQIVIPNMGKDGVKLLPFFLTLFFFILFANLIGLFPFMVQPTKNINVTAALALITFGVTQVQGMRKNGVGNYLKNLVPPGVPSFVLPIMIVVEFIGLFTKPFSLLMRLFANIVAGSIIILSLIGLIFILEYAGILIAVPFTLFIYCLELFIALLQAYIFTMLSTIYINMAIHQEH